MTYEFEIILNSMILAIIPVLLYIGYRLLKRNVKSFWAECFHIGMIVYLTGLIYIVWFSTTLRFHEPSINLIPFNTLINYIELLQESTSFPVRIIVTNILGNILLTVPLGVWFKYREYSKKSLYILSIVIPFVIEIGQLAFYYLGFGARSIDIDDFLLNACGILLGYYIMRTQKKFAGRNRDALNGERLES